MGIASLRPVAYIIYLGPVMGICEMKKNTQYCNSLSVKHLEEEASNVVGH
jgi:hypothetical protein